MNRIKEIIKCYNENAIVRRVNVVLVYIFLFNVIKFCCLKKQEGVLYEN